MASTPTYEAAALAAFSTNGLLKRHVIERRECLDEDVKVKILYCGICHSDVHLMRAEWPVDCNYPMVPGHEMVGEVVDVGSKVSKWTKGQIVGIGVFVDSCRDCVECKGGEGQYCNPAPGVKTGVIHTYNAVIEDAEKIHIHNHPKGEVTFGGYSSHMTVDQNYLVSVPTSLPLERVAPLLCAGITVYSPLVNVLPLVQSRVKRESLHVGVVGFGGLGHLAVKFAHAMGHTVTVISRSDKKKDSARKAGASKFLKSTDSVAMDAAERTFDFIVDTVSANHPLGPLLNLLQTDGIICMVGLPAQEMHYKTFDIVTGRRGIVGSNIGGIPETQQMLDFCAKHNIAPDVSLIDARDANKAVHTLVQNQSESSRFVIKVAATLAPALTDASWQTNEEPAIDLNQWEVHQDCNVYPESANVHTAPTPAKAKGGMPIHCVLYTVGLSVLCAMAAVKVVKRMS